MKLKPAKRSSRLLSFDREAKRVLRAWLQLRKQKNQKGTRALFLSHDGLRISLVQINRIVEKYASRLRLHNPESESLVDRFTSHCCRHWFKTHLIRAGMPRDFIKELRGDIRHEAIDIYNHIDKKELKESYLAHIPQLSV